jgi:DNA repair protein RecN (Recombination protein N)
VIERFALKENLTFNDLSLEFDSNFIIFSGPSGAGKSILMEALLALFGLKNTQAKRVEASIKGELGLQKIGLQEDDPNIFILTKDRSTRYFINGSQVSKKILSDLSKSFINYLTLREFNEFENENILELLDNILIKRNKDYKKIIESFKEDYKLLIDKQIELKELMEKERKIEELKEFAKFEIEKIESINPSVDEYEELMRQKRELSKREKLQEAINEASGIFEFEHIVSKTLNLLEAPTETFDEAINELKMLFESANDRLSELENLDIEALLDRLDSLSKLKSRYGSIEEALEYLRKKRVELSEYENIEFRVKDLQKDVDTLQKEIQKRADTISKERKEILKEFSKKVNSYLNSLYLENLNFTQTKTQIHPQGIDKIEITLNSTPISKISSGELNRVRLSYLAAASDYLHDRGGVLIVDEIDANLSGKESMAIAKVLELLSKNYQIFAISHQPQLSSKAHTHFLIYKEGGESFVKRVEGSERVEELSRMISGENITEKAREFAKSLLK